jgi:cytochrome c oxidase subunit 4
MNKHAEPHITPMLVYLAIGGSLLLLTLVTVAVSFINLGFFNIVVALGIATFKALLVAFFFMHLYYDNKLYFLIFTLSMFFLTVLISITMLDTMRRGDIYGLQRHIHSTGGKNIDDASGYNGP